MGVFWRTLVSSTSYVLHIYNPRNQGDGNFSRDTPWIYEPKLSSVRPEVFDLSIIRSSQTFNGQFKYKQNLTSDFSPIAVCHPVKLSSFLDIG